MGDPETLSDEQQAFKRALAGDDGIVSSLDGVGDVALVLFGGINSGVGMLPFEFFRLTEDLPVKKIFLRDHEQAWYHRGVRGVGESIDEVGEHLAYLIVQADVKRVVMTGNSMGGYAALLFGKLLSASEVVALSPQTFLSRGRRAVHFDRRWRPQIAAMHSASGVKPGYFDLGPVFRHYSGPTVFHVHYSTASRQDRAHARQLRRCPSVTLHAYESGGHGLAKWLRETGQLQPILQAAIDRS